MPLSLTQAASKLLPIAPESVHAQFHEQFHALQDWEQFVLIAPWNALAPLWASVIRPSPSSSTPPSCFRGNKAQPAFVRYEALIFAQVSVNLPTSE